MNNINTKKGFTLIELLIVIGILAILATVVILVLNPAELFRQARDSQRTSDLSSIQGAVSLYLATVATIDLENDTGAAFACATNFGASVAGATERFTGAPVIAHAGVFSTDGSGWVSVNLGSIPGGSPLSTLPRDPVNDTANNYEYRCSSNALATFELNSVMESLRYSNTGTDDVESTDGGDDADGYEVGNDPGLNL